MLTREHAIVAYKGGEAIPDRLTTGQHGQYPKLAAKMLAVYRLGTGRTRRELHCDIEKIFANEAACPPRRIHAFAKLLDDRSEFETDPQGEAAALRLKVFETAAPYHPVVVRPLGLYETDRERIVERLAKELDRSWPKIEEALYADVLDYQRLIAFAGYPSPEALLSRYNVAQVQAALYQAERLIILATQDFKTILRYAKLARLMLEISRLEPSTYRIECSGPATVLTETRRYGVNMARFLPALLACQGWAMRALLRTPWGGRVRLELAGKDGLKGHLPPLSEFDSGVEEKFAEKFGEGQAGWQLRREAEILHAGQHVFVPDFAFRHAEGLEVHFEIVGFWTPEYLSKKRETLARFKEHRILIALPERSLREGVRPGERVVLYKTVLKVKAVLEALEKIRRGQG